MFDLLVLLLVMISTAVGFGRGGVREIVSLAAIGLAALVAVVTLPASRLLLGLLVHPRWLAAAGGIALVFILTYLAVRTFGAAATTRLRATRLGGVDHGLGALIGLLRGLTALGVVALVLESAPWPGGKPRWLAQAHAYPVAHLSGRAVARLAPRSGAFLGGFARYLGDGVAKEFGGNDASADDTRTRHRLDDSMERAR